jgi:hypothetical protein
MPYLLTATVRRRPVIVTPGPSTDRDLTMLLTPKNWHKHQHYKNRTPPWIKFHRSLLNDRVFICLPTASKALLPLLWLLASESKDGVFDASTEELVFRLRMTAKEVEESIKALIDKGFLLDASTMQAPCYQVATPETERETEKEKDTSRKRDDLFDLFWKAYPKRVGKDAARKAFDKRKPNDELVQTMIQAIGQQQKTDSWIKGFVPNPATWLNEGRWQDEVDAPLFTSAKPSFLQGAI